MIFREAEIADIEEMMVLRLAVKENILSNPALVPYEDMVDYMTRRGKSWVCKVDDRLVGFSICDLEGNSVWALFVEPGQERKGIGKRLQELMLEWYFSKSDRPIWLETAAGTRAETFYRNSGWVETHREDRKPSNPAFPDFTEVTFELTKFEWLYYVRPKPELELEVSDFILMSTGVDGGHFYLTTQINYQEQTRTLVVYFVERSDEDKIRTAKRLKIRGKLQDDGTMQSLSLLDAMIMNR